MTDQLISVPLARIVERSNYRQEYDKQFVQDIADDMTVNGFKIEWPLTVYQTGDLLTVIDGHTRLNAARLAAQQTGLGDSFPVWVAVKPEPTNAQFYLMQLAANEQRRNPDEISQGIGYKQALDAGASLAELCKSVGHTKDYVERRIALLSLIPEVQKFVKSGNLPITYAVEMTKLDRNFQLIALKYFNETKSPNKDEFAALVNELYTKQSQATLFDLALFTQQPIETTLNSLNIQRKPSRDEIERELEATRKMLERIKREATAEILKLRALINQKKAS